jgi:hypothetical protein
MNQQHPNLNYEFYFLFQVKCNYANEPWREPSSLSNELFQDNLHSIRIDKDKRLFRYAPPPTKTSELPPLNEWEVHLQQGWAQIQACYQDAFQPQAFMGVALLILDDSVATHQIQCNTTDGTVTFKPATEKTPNEKILLKVEEGFGELMDLLKTPVTLEEFEPDYHPATDWNRWQIQLSSSQPPRLAPMQIGESYAEIYPNPIFAVYGLAHGILPTEVAEPLQTFLCSGKVALMWRVLSRLMMQKWQFKRLDIAAYQLRQEIDSQNDRYQQVPDARLECASNKKLELDLRDMMRMDAKMKQVLARVDAGTKTLEINRDHLEKHLHRSEQVWQYLDETPADKKYEWALAWQNGTETPLLDSFDLDIRKLKNHTTYLQDALTYLDGIRTRWQLYLDGRRLQYESNIQIMLLALTFIASFAGVVAFITQNPADVAFLLQGLSDNPEQITQIGHLLLIGISLLILIFFVLPFVYLSLKSLWKKFRCWLRQLRARLF